MLGGVWARRGRFAPRHRTAIVVAGVLAAVLSAPMGVALSLPVVLRFSRLSSQDIRRIAVYQPLLTILSTEKSPVPPSLRAPVANHYRRYCDLFGQGFRVYFLVRIHDGSLGRLLQASPTDSPVCSIGWNSITPEAWAEMNRERVD